MQLGAMWRPLLEHTRLCRRVRVRHERWTRKLRALGEFAERGRGRLRVQDPERAAGAGEVARAQPGALRACRRAPPESSPIPLSADERTVI